MIHGTLVSYMPINKAVILMSSIHTTAEVDERSETAKPEIINYYSQTTSEVDSMDQQDGGLSRFFKNILDV